MTVEQRLEWVKDRKAKDEAAARQLLRQTCGVGWSQALRQRFPRMLARIAAEADAMIDALPPERVGSILDDLQAAEGAITRWDCAACPARHASDGDLRAAIRDCRWPELQLYDGEIAIEHGPCDRTRRRLWTLDTRALLADAGVPRRLRNARLEDFHTDTPARQDALMAARGCLDGLASGHQHDGLILAGPVGTGKSYLVAAVAWQLAWQRRSIAWLTVPAALEARRRAIGDKQDRGAAGRQWAAAEDADVAILDDLGSEKPSDWAVEQVFVLVDARYQAERPIIATTNCDPDQLRDRVGERTASRLFGSTRGIVLDGRDRRLTWPT